MREQKQHPTGRANAKLDETRVVQLKTSDIPPTFRTTPNVALVVLLRRPGLRRIPISRIPKARLVTARLGGHLNGPQHGCHDVPCARGFQLGAAKNRKTSNWLVPF